MRMFDSIDVSEIPADAEAVAGYVGGHWPTYPKLAKRWPHAHRLSIAVNAGENAECLDVERGDAIPAQTPAWFHTQRSRGVKRPVFYSSLSVVPAVEAALAAAGISRTSYLIWSAHYTFRDHICDSACGLRHTADATQWTDRALGRNLDESLCSPQFFSTPPAPAYVPPDEARWKHEYDRLMHKRGPWPTMRRRVLVRRMIRRRKLIWKIAQKTGWTMLNRASRYRALLVRTEG